MYLAYGVTTVGDIHDDTPWIIAQRALLKSVQQKRFSLVMLVVVLLFMAATVGVPIVQSILVKGTSGLPFGLSEVEELAFGLTLVAGLLVLFSVLCVIYWAVPNRPHVPWRHVWPGAASATLAIGLIDYAFPFYLTTISTIARFGTTFVFVVIVLLWFYALAAILLGGATINALRFEAHEDESDDAPGGPSPAPVVK